jgi:uncharacterized protein
LTGSSQLVFAGALSAFVPWWLAVLGGMAAWWALARRARSIWSDPPRPRWRVRLLDEPLFLHFGASLFGLVLLPPVLLGWLVFRPSLSALLLATHALGLMISAYALWLRRSWVAIRTIEVPIAGLSEAFDGYRIVQLSDLHIGSLDRLERGLEWAKRANALAADLAVVTGDLVTSGTAYYADAARVLGALEARDGTVAVLGNHDQWNPPLLVQELEQQGVKVLRNEWQLVERHGQSLVVAGLDDMYAGRSDLELALVGRPSGAPTVLLAHYPTFFEAAAQRGVALTLSGHTHGGQIGLPFLANSLNFARLSGQASRGLRTRGASHLYVNAGLGTSGPPLRLGVPPEIALIVLRRA